MKKIILAAIVMMVSLSTFAQREPGTVTIQPRIGVSAADFNNTDDTSARVGMVAGAEVEYYVNNIVGIAAGLLYSQQGAELDTNNAADVKFKIDYINVPIIANIYVWKGLALKAGLQPGININSKFSGARGDIKTEVDMDVNTFDISIPAGISYVFGRLVLDARYNFGLLKIFDDDYLDSKNLTFQLAIGYKFSL
ncbi:MAG: PorT family protein [Bacteroidaceae bacterium]|nr:PorT family protein [Bacteroidaceae bacterium]